MATRDSELLETLPRGRHGLPREAVRGSQRRRILQGMIEVVADRGYAEARISDAIEAAGVSRKTFYELFSDKEECFLAAYDEVTEHVSALVEEAFAAGDGPEDRIERALRAYLGFWADEPDIARMCVVEVLAAGPAARARRAAATDRLADLLAGALLELRGDKRLSELSARGLVGGVQELIYGPIDAGDTDSLPDLAEAIVASQVAPLALIKA